MSRSGTCVATSRQTENKGRSRGGRGALPRVVDLARVHLDLEDLAALVVDVRADDEALAPVVPVVGDGDDVAGLGRGASEQARGSRRGRAHVDFFDGGGHCSVGVWWWRARRGGLTTRTRRMVSEGGGGRAYILWCLDYGLDASLLARGCLEAAVPRLYRGMSSLQGQARVLHEADVGKSE